MKRKEILSYLFYFVLAWLAIAGQMAFFGSLGRFWAAFNPLLAILVLMVTITDFKKAIFFALACGLILDIFSSLPFGLYLAVFFATVLVLEILFLNFFTSREFYPLMIMGALAVVFYNLFFLLILGALYLLGATEAMVAVSYWQNFLYQLISTTIFLLVIFSVSYRISKVFKPIFLKP